MISLLIVEDYDSVRQLYEVVFELDGRFDVITPCCDAAEALASAKGWQPDLILLDLAMPRMSGREALPLLQKLSPRSVIIFVTALMLADGPPRIGEDGCIEKVHSPDELISRVMAIYEEKKVVVSQR